MTAVLAREQPQRLRSAILGGIGIGLIEGGGPGENVGARAGGAVAGGRHRSGRANVSRLCRPDPLRPPRARRLPARLAASDDAEEAAGIAVPVLIAVGTDGRDRRLRARARKDHSGRRKCSTFRTAITCARSATRSTRPASSIFCHDENDLPRGECLLPKSDFGPLDFPKIPTNWIVTLSWMARSAGVYFAERLSGTDVRPPCYNVNETSEFARATHGSASGQSAGVRSWPRSIRSGIACGARRKTSFAASLSLPPSSIRPCCITSAWKIR